MSSPKRPADQISGDGDASDNEFIGRTKACRHQEDSDAAREAHSNPPSSYATLSEFLANHLPTNLLPAHVKESLIWESNARLDLARREGIDLASISIGEDCLPVWPSFSWDPSSGSLHSAIQERATAAQNAQDLGDLFRNDLISKSNRKLDEARQQDQSLDEMVIGDSLLPELKAPGDDFEVPIVIDDDSSDDETDYETDPSSVEIDTSFVPSVGSIETLTDSSDSSLSPNISQSATQYTSESSSEYLGSFNCNISELLNPFAEEESLLLNLPLPDNFAFFRQYQPHNIIHDVQMVSESRAQTVDLEVFVADEYDSDCSSLGNLLEAELAVDRESYEYWNATDEAVDFEFPNMEVRCKGELFSVEEVKDGEEVHFMHTQGKLLLHPVPTIEEPEDPVTGDKDAVDSASPSTIFEEEDGSFRW